MPNGLCFNPEGTRLYVTDTGVVQRMSEGENITKVSSRPATMCVTLLACSAHLLTSRTSTVTSSMSFARRLAPILPLLAPRFTTAESLPTPSKHFAFALHQEQR